MLSHEVLDLLLGGAHLEGGGQLQRGFGLEAGVAQVESKVEDYKNQIKAATTNRDKKQTGALATGDAELVAKIAALTNRARGTTLPEEGYTVGYQVLPLGGDEARTRDESVRARMGMGLLTRADALRVYHPEWTDQQILTYLAQVDRERALLGSIAA